MTGVCGLFSSILIVMFRLFGLALKYLPFYKLIERLISKAWFPSDRNVIVESKDSRSFNQKIYVKRLITLSSVTDNCLGQIDTFDCDQELDLNTSI